MTCHASSGNRSDLFDTVDVQQATESDEPTTGPGTKCEECGGEIEPDAPDDAVHQAERASRTLARWDHAE